MKYGVYSFLTAYSISPPALGRALEERGFESLFLPEHTHIPTSRKSPWGGGPELPKMYYDVFDPFVSLGAVAATTLTLKLGTGICLVVERDPIVLAKEISTLDQLSGGRFLFGVGGGWNAEEMADHGTAFETRFELMAERIEAMKTIWTRSKPQYHGKYVNFDEMMTWPKPVQKPHPPILVGGAFPWGANRAIRYGDGWMPIGGREQDVVALLPRFRQMAAEAGRDPATLPVTMFGPRNDGGRLQQIRDAGVERVVFDLPPASEEELLPILDDLALLAEAVG
jgi:probable F420-dependent oxidoreductase